jgi:hypothetical protein
MDEDGTLGADDHGPEDKPRNKGHIPHLPDREATFSVLRHWVSNAIGLPAAVRLDSVIRFGRGEEDSLSLTLSNGLTLRCDRQKRLQAPGPFQSFFASESDGLCAPKYLSRAEVGDVFIALCRLATATAEQDELSELSERLAGFVTMAEVMHTSLTPEYRYESLRRLQARAEYDRKAATDGKGGKYLVRPVLVVDHEWPAYLVRHSEFITHLRVVFMQTLNDNFLKGRMTEVGCEYHSLQGHAPRRRGHARMAFYTLPTDMAVPHHGDE